MYGWRHREDGALLVWDLPDGPPRVPVAAVSLRADLDRGELKFHDVNERMEAKYGLPRYWLAAMEARESNFNARAYRIERHADGSPIYVQGRLVTGVGALQITNGALKGQHTDEELFDVDLNVDIGAKYIAFLISKYGRDFPRVAAAYNAGSAHPDPSNPWNLHQTDGHVSSEVSFLNYFIEREKTEHGHELAVLEGVAMRQRFDARDIFDPADLRRPSPDPDEAPPTPRNDVPDFREAVTLTDVRRKEDS